MGQVFIGCGCQILTLFLHETWLLVQFSPLFSTNVSLKTRIFLQVSCTSESISGHPRLLEHCKLQRSVLALPKGLFR